MKHVYAYVATFDGYVCIGKSLENNRYFNSWLIIDGGLAQSISKLYNNITSITGISKTITVNWLNGGINNSGEIVDTPTNYFYHTSPITLKKGETVFFSGKINAAISAICVCNSAGTSFEPKVKGINDSSTPHLYAYTADSDCYVCLSKLSDTGNIDVSVVSISTLLSGVLSNIDTRFSDIIKVSGKHLPLDITWNDGYYVSRNSGEKKESQYFSLSSPIAVNKGDIILTDQKPNGPMSLIGVTNAAGTTFTPKVDYTTGGVRNTFFYIVEEDGYVYICKSLESNNYYSSWKDSTSDLTLCLLQYFKAINNIEEEIDEIKYKRDYPYFPPLHVMGIDTAGYGREYATSLYPESITGYDFTNHSSAQNRFTRTKINGQKKVIFYQNAKDYTNKVTTKSQSLKLGGDGLEEHTFNVNYVRAKRINAQNKPIFLLCLGDSITNQATYPAYIKMFADMDNVDINNISLINLGSYIYTGGGSYVEYEYKGNTYQITKYTEGRGGWATYTMANWPFAVRLNNSGTANLLSGEGMWYLAGMATKTLYDSSTPGQTFEAWTGSAAQRVALVNAVCGRYKPDLCEALWNNLHIFRKVFERSGEHSLWYYSQGREYQSGDTIPAYSSATSDSIMSTFIDIMLSNPDNVFFDIDYARAYTGSHVWTNKVGFNIAKWLERYRTLADDGTPLTMDSPNIGTKVTADTLGNPVCTPNFIIDTFGTNDEAGATSDDFGTLYSGMESALTECMFNLLDSIKEQVQTANVGYGFPRASGVFFPEDWQDYAAPVKIDWGTGWPKLRVNNRVMNTIGSLDLSKDYNYVPIFHTGSPLSGTRDMYIEDFDNPNKILVCGADLVHPDNIKEKSIAYQILAWIYWCLQ